MEELLRLKERVEIAIEIGESYFREFKSAVEGSPENKRPRDLKEVCYDIAKTLVAFANADGGELFVGIEDDNSITGLPFSDEKISIILQSPLNNVLKETPLPLKRASLVTFKEKKIAYFSVEKGSKFVHQTSKGECFQRKDRESVPTALESIKFLREEEISREYDRQFIEIAGISDLDINLISSICQSERFLKTMSAEKFLQYLELAEFDGNNLRLRRAALLLFAKDAVKWHPRSRVRILKIKGIEEKTGENFNVQEVGEISGNIFQLIESSWELLRPHLTETRFSKDAIFQTQIIYPELACRETLINAITHRDYSIEGRGIELKIFDDRLEILSPGKLLSSITIKDLEELKGVHQSRNTYIARALREFGYVRELGEGIRRIFEVMKGSDLVKPKIESPNKSFIVTLYYKFVYSKEEKLWLDNFDSLNLTREQKIIVRLGSNGRLISTKEIFEQVGIVSEDNFRQLIESLRSSRILINELTTAQVNAQKRLYKNSRKAVPRFRIVLPNSLNFSQKEYKDTAEYSKIYVTNLPYSTTELDLENLFSKFGEISDISIPKDFNTGNSRGFAFIEFEKKNSVKKALDYNVPIVLNGRKIFLQDYKKL